MDIKELKWEQEGNRTFTGKIGTVLYFIIIEKKDKCLCSAVSDKIAKQDFEANNMEDAKSLCGIHLKLYASDLLTELTLLTGKNLE